MTIIFSLRGDRPAADGPFFALVVLGTGLVLGLVTLVARYFLTIQHTMDVCRESWLAAMARLQPVSGLLPLAVIILVVLFAFSSLVQQWAATRGLLQRLLARRLEVSPELIHLAQRLELTDSLDYVDDDAAYAFCHGLRRPRICVSRGLVELLDRDELEAVLLHEQHHLRHRDPFKILLSRALAAGLFFLPVAAELCHRYLAAKEIKADEVTAQATENQMALASALLKLLKAGPHAWPQGLAAIGPFPPDRGTGNVTQERIQRLISGDWAGTPFPRPWAVIVSLLIIVTIFLLSYAPLAAQYRAPVYDECATPAGQTALYLLR